MNGESRLGLDIGRVIIAGPEDSDSSDTAFFETDWAEILATPPVEGMFETVPRLVELFERRVWLVSKCGPRIQRHTEAWLDHHRFFERTGIPAGNLRFCRRRSDKAPHCRRLGITHFVDDRLDVHEALREVVPHRYLFGDQPRLDQVPEWVEHTPDWPSVEAAIVASR